MGNEKKDAGRISRRLFADIAEWVEPGSPVHLSMLHGHLRGRTKQQFKGGDAHSSQSSEDQSQQPCEELLPHGMSTPD